MAKLNRVTVLAPAKLNLALDVVGTLPNGYHDLDMTMQAITLYEKVVLARSSSLNLSLPGSPVAANDSNTAIKAAIAFFRYTGLLAGVDITIYKNVPVRAGMAGGSADAAAVLVGLNALYGAHLSMSELCALGAKIGADVPFALMGGTCRVQGVGEACGKYADRVFFSADDPDLEDPRDIDIRLAHAAADGKAEIIIEPDRTIAVERALREAPAGSIVVLGGKGSEDTQRVNGEYVYYESDPAIAKRVLAELEQRK